MRELSYKHFFHVTNGKFVWENLEMFNLIKNNLEGKRGYAIIEEEPAKASSNQLAYYFGGIIRKECMNSNAFAGLKEYEIHSFLLEQLRGTTRLINGRLIDIVPDFHEITRDKAKMSKYIEEAIALLQVEFDIHPKPASHYKYNKFYIETKHIK